MSKKAEKEARKQLGLPELDVLRAQMIYDQVLEDMARYAEKQKKEIPDQERKALASNRLQPSGLAGGGRRD